MKRVGDLKLGIDESSCCRALQMCGVGCDECFVDGKRRDQIGLFFFFLGDEASLRKF